MRLVGIRPLWSYHIFDWCRNVGFVSSRCQLGGVGIKDGVEISVQRALGIVRIGDKYGTHSPLKLGIANDRLNSLIERFILSDKDEEDTRTDAFHSCYSTLKSNPLRTVSIESKLIGADTICHGLHRANT